MNPTIPVISTLNLKGGCSKTSIITNLGGVMCSDKCKPILIDMDEQQSATQWSSQGNGIFPFPVIPLLEKNAAKVKDKIAHLARKHEANIILLDTPPQLEESALIAALISDLVLIPVSPSPLDLWAARHAVNTIKESREERRGDGPKAVLVPSRLINRTTLAKELHGSLKTFGEPVGPPIYLRVAIAESAIAGTTIDNYAPNSHGHIEFNNLLKFVNKELKK